MPFRATVARAVRLRCPRCGRGRLFRGFFAMNEACSSCGLDLLQEQGYYVGAMYVNYLITAVPGLAAALVLLDRVPLSRLVPTLALFAIVFPVITYRWSKALWLGIELYVRRKTTEPGSG